jgi:pyroglutamyl-peptidase
MTIEPMIITGFEKFHAPYSPSEDVALYFKDREIAGSQVVPIILYNELKDDAKLIISLAESAEIRAILSIGPAAHRFEQIGPAIRIEKRGRNLVDAPFYDYNGKMPKNEKIEEECPEFVNLEWDAEALAEHLRKSGIRAESSDDAGTYIGNDLLFRLERYLQQKGASRPKFGFIQVPWLKEYTEGAKGIEHKAMGIPIDPALTMPLSDIAKGVELIVERMLD